MKHLIQKKGEESKARLVQNVTLLIIAKFAINDVTFIFVS